MRIYFIGDFRSPFIKQDFELLAEINGVYSAFNLGRYAKTFWQIPTFIIRSLLEWSDILSSNAIWIWYADYPAIPFVLMAKLFGKPVVINLGGYEVYNGADIGYGNQTKTIRGACSRWVLRNATRVIVQSYAYKDIVENLVPETIGKVAVIPPYIDTTLCDGPMPEKKDIAVTASCRKSNDVLKGIPTFTAAMSHLPYGYEVMRNLSREEYIRTLRQAKVYCQLSYTEQFGVSLVEAMACGCVPVLSQRDGLLELIWDEGVRVPYGDVKATADAIQKAMTMDGSKARERARGFSKEHRKECIDRMLRIIVEPTTRVPAKHPKFFGLVLRIPVKYSKCFGKMRTDYGGNNDIFPNWPCCECDARVECEKKTFGWK